MQNCLTLFRKREVLFPLCVFVLTLLLYLPQIFLRDAILRDAACRYAPMAESFAAGHFRYAFHPRVQSLHPLISGCICYLSGCSGFIGVQLSSLLFLGLCVFPLYSLLKTVFDRKTAGWGILLLPLASPVTAVCVSGLRESHKMFVLLVISLGVVSVFKEREKYRGVLLTGIGCGLAFCTRIDQVLPSLCLLLAAGAMTFAAKKNLKLKLALLFTCLPFIFFETAVNFYVSGKAVPGSHYIRLLQVFPVQAAKPGIMFCAILVSALFFVAFSAAGACLLRSSQAKKIPAVILITSAAVLTVNIIFLLISATGLDFASRMELLVYFVKSVFSGLNIPLFLTALAGFYVSSRQKNVDDVQKFLFFLFFFWVGATLFQTVVLEHKLYISKRYLLPYSLLLAGWSVSGIAFCARIIREKTGIYSGIILKTLWIILPCICLFHAYSNIFEYKINRDKRIQIKTLRTISNVIRNKYSGPGYFTPEFSFFEYRGNRCPKISFRSPGKAVTAAYSSGGSFVLPDKNPDFFVAPSEEKFSEKQWRKIAENLPFGKIRLNVWEYKKEK